MNLKKVFMPTILIRSAILSIPTTGTEETPLKQTLLGTLSRPGIKFLVGSLLITFALKQIVFLALLAIYYSTGQTVSLVAVLNLPTAKRL